MSLKRYVLALFFACACMSLNPLRAQCKSFTKRKCLPHLAPYMNNGQLNTATMSPGQTADMIMNFNSGQSYRIIVCGEGVLGPIEFVVKDASGNILFTNKKQQGFTDTWDFSMEQTMQLTVSVKVADQLDKTQFNTEGCVTVLVGFKK